MPPSPRPAHLAADGLTMLFEGNGTPYMQMELAVPGCGCSDGSLELPEGDRDLSRKLTGSWDINYLSPDDSLALTPEITEVLPLVKDQRLPPVKAQPSMKSSKRRFSLRAAREWWPAVDPNLSSFLNVWDASIFCLIVVVAFLAPVQVVFTLSTRVDGTANAVLDTAFLIDILLQFFVMTPDPSRPAVYTRDPVLIAKRYMSGWFWVDLVSVLPGQAVKVLVSAVDSSKDVRLLRALRLCRLLRLARFSRLAQRWHTSIGFSYALISMVRNFAIVVLCCHWMACAWSALAFRDVTGPTWISAVKEAKGGPDDMYRGQIDIYAMSLYWAVVTLTSIGYGDINPQNRLEYFTATLCMSVMASVWAYFIGAICGILATLQPHDIAFKQSLDDLNLLLAERRVPSSLRHRLRRYFHECKDLNKHRIERSIIDQMSPGLQGEVALLLHSQWIDQVWYLRGLNSTIIIWAARHLSMMVYAPKETIIQDRTIFIVRRGVCARRAQVLVSGNVWGEDMLVHNEHLRDRAKTTSLSYLDVCMLSYSDIVDIVEKSPEAKSRLAWARVRIAIARAVIRIASEMQRLKAHPNTAEQFRKLCQHDEARLLLYKDIIWGKDVASRLRDYVSSARHARRITRRSYHPTAALIDSDEVHSSKNSACEEDVYKQMAAVVQKLHDLQEAQEKSQSLIAAMHLKIAK